MKSGATAIALFALGVGVNLVFGRRGFMPLDHSIVFDGGWRLLSGRLSSDAARAAPPQAVKIGSTFFDCGTLADRRAV